MKGLIIKPYWADLIFSEKKRWEIRGSATSHRGLTTIIKSGTGKVFGTVEIEDCIPLHGPNNYELIIANQDKHHVPLGSIPYRKPWAWVMQNARILTEPIPYSHPQGAVIWVTLPEEIFSERSLGYAK